MPNFTFHKKPYCNDRGEDLFQMLEVEFDDGSPVPADFPKFGMFVTAGNQVAKTVLLVPIPGETAKEAFANLPKARDAGIKHALAELNKQSSKIVIAGQNQNVPPMIGNGKQLEGAMGRRLRS